MIQYPTPPVGGRRPGVLVVDDDVALLDILTHALQECGFAVWPSSCGAEGIRLYREHRDAIDVALLDIQMPGLSGPQTLFALRKINRRLGVLLMSVDPAGFDGDRLRGLEVVGFVEKPLDPIDLSRKLRLAAEGVLAPPYA
jgi:two-component system, cell cycle sensor histidine kinase and response regulator CckA